MDRYIKVEFNGLIISSRVHEPSPFIQPTFPTLSPAKAGAYNCATTGSIHQLPWVDSPLCSTMVRPLQQCFLDEQIDWSSQQLHHFIFLGSEVDKGPFDLLLVN